MGLDAGDIRAIDLMLAEQRRSIMAEVEALLAGPAADIQRLADGLGSLLDRAAHEEPTGEPDADSGESADTEPDGGDSSASEDELDEPESGALELTEDGELLEEVPVVTSLTPAEAQDEIEPLRTHPLLRRLGRRTAGI